MSLVFGPDTDQFDGTRGRISANVQRESAPTFRKFGTKLRQYFVPKVHTMFNLYQNINKKDDGDGRRGSDVTGHDRFCQEHPKSRKKRRPVGRRTQSAIELDSEAMTTAREVLRRGRSASIEEDDSEEEKGYQLTNKIDSLAKILFNRVSAARAYRENETRHSKMSDEEMEIGNVCREHSRKNRNFLSNDDSLGRFKVDPVNTDYLLISKAQAEPDSVHGDNDQEKRNDSDVLDKLRVENAAGCSYSKSLNAESRIGNIHKKYVQKREFRSERYLRAIASRDRSRRATWNRNAHSRHYPCLTNIICFCRRSRTDNYELEEIKMKNEIFSETDENGNRNRGHQYTALGSGPAACEDVGEYLEMEKRTRDRALSICQTYIQQTARYILIKQLNNVGSRVDKYWFAVRDTMLKTDRLLTLVPLNRNCSLSICPSTKDILNNLFLALQHPYICPVLNLEFVEYEGQNYVILVQPINQGSLKDLICGIERNCWNEDWGQKYAARGKGLPLPQIQQMGRQILEALVFLKDRRFPTVTHLHSGNVVVQNGVARLAGLENSLLGFTSRIHPVVTSRSPNGSSIDSICFGHMLFEMCAGYELCSFKPSSMHLSDLKMYPQVANLMTVIFSKTNGSYPSVEELLVHDLFRNIDLREMRSTPVTIFRPTLTPSILNLLDGIKRHNSGKRMSSTDTEDMISLKSPEVETAEEDSLLTQIYNELSNTTV